MNFVMAYFDPSAGSLLLQALVGGFGGIMVVGRYLWMQFRGHGPVRAMLSQSQDGQVSTQCTAR